MTPHLYRDPSGLWVCECEGLAVVAPTAAEALAMAEALP